MLSIILAVILLFAGYTLAGGRIPHTLLLSMAVVVLLGALNPQLHTMHPAGYLLAWLWVWLGVQVVLPAMEGQRMVAGLRVGRVALAVVIA